MDSRNADLGFAPIAERLILGPAAAAGAHIAKLGILLQNYTDRLNEALALRLRGAEGQRSR